MSVDAPACVLVGQAVNYSTAGYPNFVSTADVNADGTPDILCGGQSITVLLGNGDGTFQPAALYAAPGGSRNVVAADVDGDGVMDLLAAAITNQDGEVEVLRGNGDGTFAKGVGYPGTPCLYAIAVADFNRDGRVDVVTSTDGATCDGNGDIALLLGNGDGTFGAPVVLVDIARGRADWSRGPQR